MGHVAVSRFYYVKKEASEKMSESWLYTEYKTLFCEKLDGIGVVRLNRPNALNAINREMIGELYDLAGRLVCDNSLRALVITGEGKAFAAGADISEMADMDEKAALEFAKEGCKMTLALENLPFPVIAAINGYALGGGCEIALACDIRLASERAKLGQPEVTLGITPGFGATAMLPLTVGIPAAARLLMTGEVINAAEAKRIGLVHDIYPPETLMEEAMRLAERLAQNSPSVIARLKAIMKLTAKKELSDSIECENARFAACFAHPDQRAGMRAFLEKSGTASFLDGEHSETEIQKQKGW